MLRILVPLFRWLGNWRRWCRSWLYRTALGAVPAKNFRAGRRLRIKADRIRLGANISIGDNVRILCRDLVIEDGASIGDNVRIEGVGSLYIGAYVMIGDDVYIDGLTDAALSIGHHSWIGRRSILNASADLTIGRRVCIGIGSRIFTHGCWWESVEGYQPSYKPVTIHDDAWLALGATVQPGANIGERVLVNSGAVAAGDLEAHGTYAGIPAVRQGELRPEALTKHDKYLLIFQRLNALSAKRHQNFEYGRPLDFVIGRRSIRVVFWETPPAALTTSAVNFVPGVSAALVIKGRVAVVDMTEKTSFGDEQLAHPLIDSLKDHTLRILPEKYR